MDITAVIGMLVGVAAILGGQALEGGHVGSLIQGPAALIVLGGTFGATMLSFSLRDLRHAASDLITVFRPRATNAEQIIATIVEMAKIARKEGLLALEKNLRQVDNEFLKRYLQLIIDGLEANMVREQMEIEIELQEEERMIGAKVFESAGGYAPTIGIIGAVLGLIHVMQSLDDPTKIGGGIAVAFVATVYGVGIANLILLPMSNKLKRRNQEQMISYALIMEGLLALQAGHNPKVIDEKLRVYLLGEKQGEGRAQGASIGAEAERAE